MGGTAGLGARTTALHNFFTCFTDLLTISTPMIHNCPFTPNHQITSLLSPEPKDPNTCDSYRFGSMFYMVNQVGVGSQFIAAGPEWT